MKKYKKGLKECLACGVFALLISNGVHAGIPPWTYSAPSLAKVIIADGEVESLSYTVTNHSRKAKNLILRSTSGLSASSCYLAGKGSTCNLTLTINGSRLPKEGIHSGPVMCEQGNPNQCYQPASGNVLNISRLSLGHLELSQHGVAVSKLALSPGDSGTLLLTNTGGREVSSLDIQFPFGWQSYFTNNCPIVLASQQSCSIFYTIPTPSAVGILNPLNIRGVGSDNRVTLPVSIQAMGPLNCWGNNDSGQLGDGTKDNRVTPVAVDTINNAVSISGGAYHTCALLETGLVNCWGENTTGQLGDGSTVESTTPIAVNAINTAMAITAGNAHSCALLKTGSVNCWGANFSGQLGDGTMDNSNTPVAVDAINNAVAITAGSYHTCALLETGSVSCWGANFSGQLGDGTMDNRNTPVAVDAINNAVAITAGESHTCALLKTGLVQCWGGNFFGQLGDGSNINSYTPVAVNTINNVLAINAGDHYVCALLKTGSINCWGSNLYGQLGDGSYVSKNTPVAVSSINNAVVITGGADHTCALLETGSVNCWGENVAGQLGDGTINQSNIPVTTTCSGVGCSGNLSALGLFNHSLSYSSCAIVSGS